MVVVVVVVVVVLLLPLLLFLLLAVVLLVPLVLLQMASLPAGIRAALSRDRLGRPRTPWSALAGRSGAPIDTIAPRVLTGE